MQNDPGRTEGNASGVPAPFVLTELLRLIQPFSFKAFLIHGLLFQEVRHVDPQGTTVTTMKGGKRVEEAISVTNHLDHAHGDMGRGLPAQGPKYITGTVSMCDCPRTSFYARMDFVKRLRCSPPLFHARARSRV